MFKLLVVMLSFLVTTSSAADLSTRKHLNLATIKTMVAAAEAEAKRLNVEVTICIVEREWQLAFPGEGGRRIAQTNSVLGAEKGAALRVLPESVERWGRRLERKGISTFWPSRASSLTRVGCRSR